MMNEQQKPAVKFFTKEELEGIEKDSVKLLLGCYFTVFKISSGHWIKLQDLKKNFGETYILNEKNKYIKLDTSDGSGRSLLIKNDIIRYLKKKDLVQLGITEDLKNDLFPMKHASQQTLLQYEWICNNASTEPILNNQANNVILDATLTIPPEEEFISSLLPVVEMFPEIEQGVDLNEYL